jgi:hypothetical protein
MASIFGGVFDNSVQQQAAQDQIRGINAGYGQLSDLFGQGRAATTGAYGTGRDDLFNSFNYGAGAATNYSNAGLGYLGQGWNAATNAAVPSFQSGANAITNAINTGTGQIYGGLGGANAALGGGYNAAQDAATRNYYAGISPFMQNWAQANQGSNALADALGLNGPQGSANAVAAFQANPAYQFGQQQGLNAIQAQAQASGMGASGNALMDAAKFANNYANQGWNSYIGNLSPYLNFATQGAGGIQAGFNPLAATTSANAMQYGQLGSNNIMNAAQLANANQLNMGNWLNTNAMNLGSLLSGNAMNYGNLANANQVNLGNNLLSGALTTGGAANTNAMNLGNQLGSSFTNQGNAAYGAQTSIGNANANADLAQAQANANILGTIGQGAKFAASVISDREMKDDIELVGRLFDDQPVYRYRMKGDARHQIGLIAQDVEQSNPDAVVQFTPHVKGVDYRRATNAAAEIARRFLEAA